MFWEGLRVQKTKLGSLFLSPQKPVLVLFTVCHHWARTKRGREKIQTGVEEEELPGYLLAGDENWTKQCKHQSTTGSVYHTRY